VIFGRYVVSLVTGLPIEATVVACLDQGGSPWLRSSATRPGYGHVAGAPSGALLGWGGVRGCGGRGWPVRWRWPRRVR